MWDWEWDWEWDRNCEKDDPGLLVEPGLDDDGEVAAAAAAVAEVVLVLALGFRGVGKGEVCPGPTPAEEGGREEDCGAEWEGG